ncbi:alginate lyase family protein [Vibrio natriegens]|uniref:alginate lyase family protein n=1 Tax=Vibrio natriegens TaxID=691 RepID=UPI0035570801
MATRTLTTQLATLAIAITSTYAVAADYPNLIVHQEATKSLQADIKTKAQSSFQDWILTPANHALELKPQHFPHVAYERKDLKKVVDGIYTLTLAWHLSEDDKQKIVYREKASELIVSIANAISPSPHTPNESILLPVYEAYSIIRSEMSWDAQQTVNGWLKRQAEYFKNYKLTGTLIKNNWENVRLAILFDLAMLLSDESLYQFSVEALKAFVAVNIEPDGKTNDFMNRDAITYHAYNQQYYARVLRTVYLYKGEEAALELYKYKAQGHGSIEDAYQFWVPYFKQPAEKTHIEFVNTGWKPDLKRGDASKPYDPIGTVYAMAHMIAMEKEAADYIKTVIPDKEPHTLRLSTWLNYSLHSGR